MSNKEDGFHTEHNSNGQKESEGNYKDGKKEGLWTETHGGIKCEGNYKNNERDGKWIEWHLGGKTKNAEHFYKDGKAEGLSSWLYENGQLKGTG
jgi:antitoxin component YwqK of YwqJK toxin-antitoxin module